MIHAISFEHGRLRYLDQRFLPLKEIYIETKDYRRAVDAIKTLAVRGAPLIGIAAGYAAVLAVAQFKGKKRSLKSHMAHALAEIEAARPTAVNLFWAAARMKAAFNQAFEAYDVPEIARRLQAEAEAIHHEEIANCAAIARHGVDLLKRDFAHILPHQRLTVLTHCNTGTLATGGLGTALGVIKVAYQEGLIEKVYASETRPLLQGLRLTTYELEKEQLPYEAIADGASGFLMQREMIDFVITGADRIARNGDTANKIGTYSHAVNAAHHRRKFYIAAPVSTIDAAISNGHQITIEQRGNTELTSIYGKSVAPVKTPALNFAFDVTPASLIAAIITEKGVCEKDYTRSISTIVAKPLNGHHSFKPAFLHD